MFLFLFAGTFDKNSTQHFPIPLMNFQCEEASLKSTLKRREKK